MLGAFHLYYQWFHLRFEYKHSSKTWMSSDNIPRFFPNSLPQTLPVLNSGIPAWKIGVVSCSSAIRGTVVQSWSVGSTQLVRCPESRSVRSWEVGQTLALCSNFNLVPQPVSVIERLSARGRVRSTVISCRCFLFFKTQHTILCLVSACSTHIQCFMLCSPIKWNYQ